RSRSKGRDPPSGGPWKRLRETLRACRDSGRALPAVVTLADPTADERARHAALLRLSTPSRARRLRYELAAISEALARAGAPSEWGEFVGLGGWIDRRTAVSLSHRMA